MTKTITKQQFRDMAIPIIDKENKAIKILKKIYKNNPDIRVQRNNLDVNFTIHDFSNIKEAIKELEDLKERILHLESIERDMIMKENKSCDNCIYSLSNIVCSNKHIQKINKNYISINKYFCCNKWKNKQ